MRALTRPGLAPTPQAISLVAVEIVNAKQLGSLLHDPFANYVIQTLLTVSSDAEVAELLARLTNKQQAKNNKQ